MPSRTEAVDTFMQTLDHPLKAEIERVRGIILDANEQITEQIKWKAPSFCSNGDDRVTMRLHPQNRLQLVFHCGVKVKDSTDFVFEDSTGLLQWVAKDRAVVTIDDVEAQKAAPTRSSIGGWKRPSRDGDTAEDPRSMRAFLTPPPPAWRR